MRRQLSKVMAVTFFAACCLQAQTAADLAKSHRDVNVTPVNGESWLNHIHHSFGDTSMGKTGRLGPAPIEGIDPEHAFSPVALHTVTETVVLSGSDLYRLNCQGCHGESGMGTPPEINSVINPVRATSIPLVQERMKKSGMDISYSDATKLAEESRSSLLTRLNKGGENMPAFPQLGEAEIRPLLAYLRQLADMPGAKTEQSTVKESHLRVGEFIVKSTCHICHAATGANPEPQKLLEGAIPPLSTLTTRKNQSEFIRKVTQGAPVLMGTPPMLYRGRMPVFYYLTEEEASDVYLYLTMHPPSEAARQGPLVAASMAEDRSSTTGPSGRAASPTVVVATEKTSGKAADLRTAVLPWTVPFATLLLIGGLYFTFHEFKHLSAESALHHPPSTSALQPPRNLFERVCRAPAPLFCGDNKKALSDTSARQERKN